MSVIITFMFEPAKLQMNCASASRAQPVTPAAAGGRAARSAGVSTSWARPGRSSTRRAAARRRRPAACTAALPRVAERGLEGVRRSDPERVRAAVVRAADDGGGTRPGVDQRRDIGGLEQRQVSGQVEHRAGAGEGSKAARVRQARRSTPGRRRTGTRRRAAAARAGAPGSELASATRPAPAATAARTTWATMPPINRLRSAPERAERRRDLAVSSRLSGIRTSVSTPAS